MESKTKETKEQLEEAHGTPGELEQACKRAWIDGYISFEEAMKATEAYEREFADAPVEKATQ